MSSKKAQKTTDVNKARLAALKRLGILKDIPSRGNLSDAQKKKVRQEFKKFHAVANASPGEFQKIDITRLSESDKKELKNSGYLIANNKAFIPKQGYDKASIKQVWKRNPETGYQEKTLQITRKKGDRKVETEYIGKPLEKLEWRERLVREYQAGNFKEGEFIGVKLFDNGKFEREIVLSLDVLFRYLETVKWHDRDTQKLYDNLHLVKIAVKDFRDIGANEKSRKQADHDKYIKRKNSKRNKTLQVTNPQKLKELNAKKSAKKNAGKTKITGSRKKK
jgi:hypothetical protein